MRIPSPILTFPLLLLLCFPGATLGSPTQDQPNINSHELEICIEPSNRTLAATDRVGLSTAASGEIVFTLHKDLIIEWVKCDSLDLEFECGTYDGEETGETGYTGNLQTVRVELPGGATEFEVAYSGEIYDPINPSSALGRVRGDYTSGLISSEGVYLSSETGWYPDIQDSVATFSIRASLPEGWYAVSQGDLVERMEEEDRWVSCWQSEIPFDGCAFVANRYHVRTRRIGTVDCSTYFYEDNPELADSFLDKLEEYLPAYQELFGPFPYSRFDVVENFFTTGYGMAGFTLLGSRVLTMPYATAEGSLAHELVHCWWGNYVFPDWDTGNWCEGVTYFSTNYYWNVLSGCSEKADEFRWLDMVKYSIQVSSDDEYPVREFRTKFTEIDGHVGYGKASAVFSMLHDMMGKEDFFKALRLVLDRRGGRKASWEDFRTAFEDVAGRDLSGFFSTWLDNEGTPQLRIESAEQEEVDGGFSVRLRVVQDAGPFHLFLPVLITTEDEQVLRTAELGPDALDLRIPLQNRAISIELDPRYRVFRRLGREQIPPCLNSTLESDSILVILPSGGEDDHLDVMDYSHGAPAPKTVNIREHYKELAQAIAESGDIVDIKTDQEVTEEDLRSGAIVCLGAARYNSLASELAAASGAVELSEGGFAIDGNLYVEDEAALLLTARNPYNEDYDLTFYLGNSPQAVSRARLIFFYGWDSYVVYMSGGPVDRGRREVAPDPLRVDLQ